MTNRMIILNESVKLMEAGIINGTGHFVDVEDGKGGTKRLELPEAIHTYQAWKNAGRQVKKGEKCKARFYIWKQGKSRTVTNEETGEEVQQDGRMFMKEAFFFTLDQTEPCKA